MRSRRRIANQGIEVVVGIESRGFILGAAVAERLGAGFVPIRKPGKLPAGAIREPMRSNTAPTPSKSISTPSARGSAC